MIVYFYPAAMTPGCTTQACGIRDHSNDYADAGVTVLGVSPDTVEDVKKFHDQFHGATNGVFVPDDALRRYLAERDGAAGPAPGFEGAWLLPDERPLAIAPRLATIRSPCAPLSIVTG